MQDFGKKLMFVSFVLAFVFTPLIINIVLSLNMITFLASNSDTVITDNIEGMILTQEVDATVSDNFEILPETGSRPCYKAIAQNYRGVKKVVLAKVSCPANNNR